MHFRDDIIDGRNINLKWSQDISLVVGSFSKGVLGFALWIISCILIIFSLSCSSGWYWIICGDGVLFLPSLASLPLILMSSISVKHFSFFDRNRPCPIVMALAVLAHVITLIIIKWVFQAPTQKMFVTCHSHTKIHHFLFWTRVDWDLCSMAFVVKPNTMRDSSS